MDSDSNFERQLYKKRQNSFDSEDLISTLPDSIIARILSFLPTTRDAVRTSVLSHRWTYHWTYIMDLSFDDSEHLTKSSFINFVYGVFHHLNSVHSFQLCISQSSDYDSYYYLNDWISSLSIWKVKKISIDGDGCKLPSESLFKCQYLEDLILKFCKITVPQGSCLSNLTFLKLDNIKIICDSCDDSKRLTLSFPSLKKYEERSCTWSGVKSVSFQVPLLQVLSVTSFERTAHVEMIFSALHLTEFNYSVLGSKKTINLLNAPVASANITLFGFQTSSQGFSNLFGIDVQHLRLDFNHSVVFMGNNHSLVDIPIFATLIHLELCNFTNDLMLTLLSKASCLKTLVLEVPNFIKEPLSFEAVPDCFLYTLKVVKFRRFTGKKKELCVAKFVLENAKVLDRISFPIYPRYYNQSKSIGQL